GLSARGPNGGGRDDPAAAKLSAAAPNGSVLRPVVTNAAPRSPAGHDGASHIISVTADVTRAPVRYGGQPPEPTALAWPVRRCGKGTPVRRRVRASGHGRHDAEKTRGSRADR